MLMREREREDGIASEASDELYPVGHSEVRAEETNSREEGGGERKSDRSFSTKDYEMTCLFCWFLFSFQFDS